MNTPQRLAEQFLISGWAPAPGDLVEIFIFNQFGFFIFFFFFKRLFHIIPLLHMNNKLGPCLSDSSAKRKMSAEPSVQDAKIPPVILLRFSYSTSSGFSYSFFSVFDSCMASSPSLNLVKAQVNRQIQKKFTIVYDCCI